MRFVKSTIEWPPWLAVAVGGVLGADVGGHGGPVAQVEGGVQEVEEHAPAEGRKGAHFVKLNFTLLLRGHVHMTSAQFLGFLKGSKFAIWQP